MGKPVKIILTFLAFLCMLLLNRAIPFIPGDDFLYQFSFSGNMDGIYNTIQSPIEYYHSIIDHYFNYNNRIFPHALLQLIMVLGKGIFDVLNSIVFLLLPLFVLKLAGIYRHQIKDLFIWGVLVFLFVYNFHFDLGMSYFWTTGSVNYSWMLIPQLFLLNGILRLYANEKVKLPILICSAILVATTNENVVLSLFLLSGLLFLLKSRKKKNVQLLMISLILLAGGLIMFFSPALAAKKVNEAVAFSSKFYHFKEYFLRMGFIAVHYSPLLILLPWKYVKKLELKFEYSALVGVIIFSNLIMYLAPLVEPRTSVFGFFVGISLVLKMVLDSGVELKKYLKSRMILMLVFAVLFSIHRVPKFIYTSQLKTQNTLALSQSIEKNAVVPGYYISKRFSSIYMDDFLSDPEYVDNNMAAAFYNTKSIRLDTSIKKDRNVYWNKYKELIKSDQIKSRFKVKEINAKLLNNYHIEKVYSKETEEGGTHYLFELKGDATTHKWIQRARQKGDLKHVLLKFMPRRFQAHFLSYLDFDNNGFFHEGKTYYYNYIPHASRYEDFLIGMYDPKAHSQVGELILLK